MSFASTIIASERLPRARTVHPIYSEALRNLLLVDTPNAFSDSERQWLKVQSCLNLFEISQYIRIYREIFRGNVSRLAISLAGVWFDS